jgi:glycopeptide antibiotics resistance protein
MENGRRKMNDFIDILLYTIGAGIGIVIYDLIFNNKNNTNNFA